ncbi:hypothetical protein WN55_00210 [Dufourea novaeangliae]|uniref:Uncharacterized protein n=1 Tax=Dufourea novaeangliae TaxID=178035 RepID=A0A154PE38_DUFNO|nr:hypothetical protein WN55_00210 [Dufourea novaeangliae]
MTNGDPYLPEQPRSGRKRPPFNMVCLWAVILVGAATDHKFVGDGVCPNPAWLADCVPLPVTHGYPPQGITIKDVIPLVHREVPTLLPKILGPSTSTPCTKDQDGGLNGPYKYRNEPFQEAKRNEVAAEPVARGRRAVQHNDDATGQVVATARCLLFTSGGRGGVESTSEQQQTGRQAGVHRSSSCSYILRRNQLERDPGPVVRELRSRQAERYPTALQPIAGFRPPSNVEE